MRRLYFAANYLGKLQWQERGTAEVIACASQADEIATALHGRAEFYSIGHRKVREGTATGTILQSVFAQFNTESAVGKITFLHLTDPILDRVETAFASAAATTCLRATDALHLATAAENGFTEIHSNDKHLLSAAPLFGLRGVNVIP